MMDGKQWNELIKKFITKTKVFQYGKLIILSVYHMIFPNEIDLEHFSKA